MRVSTTLNDNYIFISRTYMCVNIHYLSTMPIAKIYNLGRTTKQTSMCIFVNGIRQKKQLQNVLLLYVQKVESIFSPPTLLHATIEFITVP